MKVCESRVINTYTYNAAGNRTSAVLKGVSCTYTTPAAHNRLASWTGGGSMTYNTAGCVTALNRTTNKVDISSLGWDCEYQLTNVVAGATTVRYTYDVAGRKASRIQGVVTEHYLYDGIHVVADTDNSGNLLRTYTYGPGVDDILAMTIHGSGGTTNYYYLKDLANTVLALANSSGSIVESYVYDAYGNVTIKNGSGTVIPVSAYGNRFLFLGREYDYTTQLYHFRARWYDPETGRWLSNDPIGISGGLNLYAFCSNDPVNFVDPMGLDFWISKHPMPFWEGGPRAPVDHWSINIGNPGGKYSRYGLYPGGVFVLATSGLVVKEEGCYTDDEKTKGKEHWLYPVIKTSQEEDEMMIAYMDHFVTPPDSLGLLPPYLFLGLNCQDFALYSYKCLLGLVGYNRLKNLFF
jgi:RHS repeat-associated protein